MEMQCETDGDSFLTWQGETWGIQQGRRQERIRYVLRDMRQWWSDEHVN